MRNRARPSSPEFCQQFLLARGLRLVVDPAQVVSDGALGNAERLGNPRVVVAEHETFDDLPFLFCQGGADFLVGIEPVGEKVFLDVRSARGDGLKRLKHDGKVRHLRDESRRAYGIAHDASHGRGRIIRGKDDAADSLAGVRRMADDSEAAVSVRRERQIHERDDAVIPLRRSRRVNHRDGLADAPRLPRDVPVRILREQQRHAFARERMVVKQKHVFSHNGIIPHSRRLVVSNLRTVFGHSSGNVKP